MFVWLRHLLATLSKTPWKTPVFDKFVRASVIVSVLLFVACAPLSAGAFATAYLRTPGTNYCNVTGATNATPIVMTVDNASACGLSNGATIVVVDVAGNTSANINAQTNQLCREVSGVSGNTFNLLDCSGTSVAGSGTYVAGSGRLGLATAYALKAPPIVWLDGAGGTLTTAQSNTAANGRANTNNPAYNALVTASNNFTGAYGSNWGADAPGANQVPLSGGENAGLYWLATGNTTALAAAVWDIANVDQFAIPMCDTSHRQCNQADGNYRWDYASMQGPQVAQLYSLVSSQLTTAQKQFFLAWALNDQSYTAGGFDVPNSHSAMTFTNGTGQVSTLTNGSTAVVGTGTSFTSYSAGDYIIFPTGGYPKYAKIASITDSTHLTLQYPWTSSSCTSGSACLSSYGSQDSNNIPFIIVPPFTTSNYGVLWYVKHGEFANLCGGTESLCQTNYPPTGGQGGSGSWNLSVTQQTFEITLGLATCADDARGCNVLEQAYEYWYDQSYPVDLSLWTGLNQSGYNYSFDRTGWMYGTIVQAMKNSFVDGGPDLVSNLGNVFSHVPSFYLYGDVPGSNTGAYGQVHPYGEIAGPGYWDVLHMQTFPIALYLNSSTTQGAYANYWMRNNSGYYTAGNIGSGGGGWVPFFYVFVDPAFTATNVSGAPTSFAFNQTDESSCVGIFGSAGRCAGLASATPATPSQAGFWTAVSKTGFGAGDTQLRLYAQTGEYYLDHSGYCVGNVYSISREVPLMTGDNSTYSACWGPGYGSGNGAYGGNGYLELGGADNRINTSGNYAVVYMPRWTDGTSEAAQNKFSYSLIDATGSYLSTANASRVQRHVAHLKKSGTQDYIIEYDDTALTGAISGASGAAIRAYYDAAIDGCGSPSSSSCITANLSAGTIQNKQSNALLNTAVLSVNGSSSIYVSNANASNTNGSYSGQNGYSWQWWVCASSGGSSCNTSATSGEWLLVHQASTTTTTTMPTLTQPSCSGTGGSCTAVQVGDASYPKVAVFARQGATLTGASFATTHSGTAQYLVAGLAAGSYTVTLNGSGISGSPFTVVANDNTLYFEGGSGTYVIAAGGGSGGTTQSPTISSFTATPGTISSGQSSTLAWSVAGTPAPTLSISPTVGTVTGSSTSVSPGTTTTYTLTASNSVGTATATATVTFVQSPTISSFTATPGSISNGQSSTLAWSVAGIPALTLSISPTVGTVTGTSISVSPSATTTYTLTATNSAGSATATAGVTVTAAAPPTVPTNVLATPMSPSQINLSWTASTSSVGIGGYRIYRNAVQIATSATTAYSDSPLTASTTYTYAIAAYDTSGNVSAQTASVLATTPMDPPGPMIGTCPVFPSNNVWNTPINNLPVDPNSSTYVNTIGASLPLHPDFSSTGGGIPYNIVPASQPLVAVSFSGTQNDPGPYPLPPNAVIEGNGAGDAHVLVVDEGNCKLYETWTSALQSNGTWTAGSGAVFDLNSNILRPNGWTSADGAGLPILPGLVRYEEVMAGQINHAIRMTAPQTEDQYIWPARHQASTLTGTQYPPMGERFRLQASFDISSYSAEVQVILTALKTYGAILADNGTSWYLTGAPNTNWNDSDLHNISNIVGSNMEAVDTSSLQVDPNSAAVAGSPLAVSGIYLDQREVGAGATVNAAAILTGPAPSGGAVVSIASSNPAAAGVPATVTIPSGATSAPVALTIESITNSTPVVLSSSYLSVTEPSPVLLVDGTGGNTNPLLSALEISPSTVFGGTGMTGSVTLTSSAPASGTVVALATSEPAAAGTSASVTVPFGATSVSFPVTTSAQTTTTTANISAQLNGETLGVPVTVLAGAEASAPAISSFTATPSNISSGSSTKLSWTVSGSPAPTLSINNGVGTVTGTSVSVSPTTTTTYTLTATNGSGTTTATTTVTVTVSATTYTLTLAVSPSGSGEVTPSPAPTGGTYLNGTQVCLTATPNTGWLFSSWSGAALNSSNCLTMSANESVTANFVASSALRFVPITPCRVVDTRVSNGAFGSPSLAAASSRSFTIPSSTKCTIPTSAAAYSLNVTVVPHGALGYLTVWPTGQTQPVTSTLNSTDGRIKANAAIIPAGTGGAVSVYATNVTDLVLDIDGYFVPAAGNPSALSFYPLAPCRIADTRNSNYGSLGPPALGASQTRSFAILSSTCDVPGTAQAYSLNFTAVPSGALGYITTYPAGQTMPLASTLNDPTGTVVANAAIVPAGAGGAVDVYASNATNLVIDINGYFAPPGTGGLSLYDLTPCRVLDSRKDGALPFSGEKDINVTASGCGAPASAQAYVFNATVVPPGPLGYLTLWPQGGAEPLVSTLNALDGAITSNMAIVPTSNGSIAAAPSSPTQLLLDIFGYFAP
jgi:hypothetical protein